MLLSLKIWQYEALRACSYISAPQVCLSKIVCPAFLGRRFKSYTLPHANLLYHCIIDTEMVVSIKAKMYITVVKHKYREIKFNKISVYLYYNTCIFMIVGNRGRDIDY